MVGVAQHLVVDGVCADRHTLGNRRGIIPTVHGVDHSTLMADASRNQLLGRAVVLQAGDFRRSRKCGGLLCNLKGCRAVYNVVTAVVVADGDRSRTGVGVVLVGYGVLRIINRIRTIHDSNVRGLRSAVILVGVLLQRNDRRNLLWIDGHGPQAGRGVLVVCVALYHVIHGVCARVLALGDGFRIRTICASVRIHHRAAGGRTCRHQLLLCSVVGQQIGLGARGQHRAGFLDGELYLCFCKRIVAARLCGDGHSRVANISVAGDVHTVIAVCQHRVIIVRLDGHIGDFICAVIVVGIGGGRDGVIRLQVVAGQSDGHSNYPGVDIALGCGGIADGVLAGVSSHRRARAVQCNRLAGSCIGVLVGARQPADCDAVGRVHQIAGLHRRRNRGIVNGCGPIIILRRNGHFRHNRLGFHGKGIGIGCRRIVGNSPRRRHRDRAHALDREHTCGRVNLGAGFARRDAPGHRPVSSAAGGLQRCDCIAVIDMLGLAGDFQRTLGRRLDFNLSGCGERIIPVGHIRNGGRISASGRQQSIRNRQIVVRPCDRVLFGINHGIAVLDGDFRLLLRAVVQEGGFRQLHRRRDGLGVNGHRNRSRVHGHTGIVGGPVYLIIDIVSTRVSPGGNLG